MKLSIDWLKGIIGKSIVLISSIYHCNILVVKADTFKAFALQLIAVKVYVQTALQYSPSCIIATKFRLIPSVYMCVANSHNLL